LGITLGDIASRFGLDLTGDPGLEIRGIAGLRDAGPGELTFLFNSRYRHFLAGSRAAAVVARPADADGIDIPVLASPRPRLAWAHIATLFDRLPQPPAGIHPAAIVSRDATLGHQVSVGANAVIESGATIADGVVVGAGCFVGERVSIGARSRLHPNVTLYHDVVIGADCILHGGAVIGADGFGFEPDATGLVKIPQVYSVRIGDRVEIGACTTIDRGALNDTVIGRGVKLDNQVQVGHGSTIGDHTVISGRTAIAGSTRIGSACLIGGAVGIIDNLEIADQVEITAMTLVSQSITSKGRYSSGTGLMPSNDWKRSIVAFRKLDDVMKRLRSLESILKNAVRKEDGKS